VAKPRRGAVAFGLALASFVLMCGGVALAFWMANLPAIDTPCGPGCIQGHTNPADQPWVGAVLVAIGLVLLPFAFIADHRPGVRPRQGWKSLRSWGAPLLWLVVIPVVEGPATYLIAGSNAFDRSCHVSFGWFSGGSDCPTGVFLPSVVVPGLLNFVPLWWLRKPGLRVRVAAVVATMTGIIGFVASIVVLYSLGPTTSWDFGFLLPNLPPHQAADLGFGAVVWMTAVIALLVIAKLPLAGERPLGSRLSPGVPG
jgi:hypothetical protein